MIPSVRLLIAAWCALAVGSVVRWLATRASTEETRQARFSSLQTWWILLAIVSVASYGELPGVSLFLWGFGLLGIREYLRLVAPATHWSLRTFLYLWTTTFYLTWNLSPSPSNASGGIDSRVATLWMAKYWQIWPVVALIVISAWHALAGTTSGFVRVAAGMVFGAVLLVCLPAHILLSFHAQGPLHGVVGFLYLVLLTESNDISQALWGRRFGKIRITPAVSPHKSLEGLLLGVGTTIGLAVALDGFAIGMGPGPAAVAGAVIGFGGFLGDINMSAVKRDCGVKDSSHLLPGQGGVLDRIDSLTFTAPLFYYLVRIWHGPS